MIFVWKVKWPQGLNEPSWAVAQTSEPPLLPGQQTDARKQSFSSQSSSKDGVKLCSSCGESEQLWWRQWSTSSWGAAVFPPVSKVICLFWNSDRVSAALQTTLLPCQYKTLPSPLPVWPPLPASACLPLGWEESHLLLQNYRSKTLPQSFLDKPKIVYHFQPHASAAFWAAASLLGLRA